MSTNTTNKNGKSTNRNGAARPRNHGQARAQARAAVQAAARTSARQQRRRSWILWGVGLAVIAGIVAGLMYTSRTTQSSAVRVAPDFTLTDTSGKSVHLADYRGKNVVLYFSEGAGCAPCLTQMTDIEQHSSDFSTANTVVLPIVMNTAAQIEPDMAANNVKTPFLIDSTGQVSREYDTLGKGMHANLPGHTFVLIDANGNQRWSGDYPNMYLSATDLLKQVRSHLT